MTWRPYTLTPGEALRCRCGPSFRRSQHRGRGLDEGLKKASRRGETGVWGCPPRWSRKERAAVGRRVIRLGAPKPLKPGGFGGRAAPRSAEGATSERNIHDQPTTDEPNRISSSGRGSPDRFRLDQRRWPVFPGRHRMRVNCNPNCNLGARHPGARRLLYWRVRVTLPGGFILSPSATLRVAGLALRVKVEHPTV